MIATSTITLFPTKYGAKNSYVKYFDEFLADNGALTFTDTSNYGIIVLYSFDFSALSGLKNLKILDIKANISHSAITISSGKLQIKLVKNFKTSGTSTGSYNDLGDGSLSCNLTYGITETTTFSDLPNTINHINENLQELTSNSETTTFGIRFYGKSCKVCSVQLAVTYEYDEYEESKLCNIFTGITPSKSLYL